MSLTDEEKKKIEDFMLDKSGVHPDTFISSYCRKEALKYAHFVYYRAVYKGIREKFDSNYEE